MASVQEGHELHAISPLDTHFSYVTRRPFAGAEREGEATSLEKASQERLSSIYSHVRWCCLYMAAVPGHHDDHFPAALLLTEKERLVSSIVGLFPAAGSVHAATIAAVRDFFIWFRGDAGVPWVRIYDALPAWQQRCK